MKTRLLTIAAVACLSGCSLFKVEGLSGAPEHKAGTPDGSGSAVNDEKAVWLSEADAAFEKWYANLQPLVVAQQAELDKIVAASTSVYDKEVAIEKVWAKTRENPASKQIDSMYFLQYPVIVASQKIHADSGGAIATSRLLSKLDFRAGYEHFSRAFGNKEQERDMFIYAAQKGQLAHLRVDSVETSESFPLPKQRADEASKLWQAAKEDSVNQWHQQRATTTAFHATDADTVVFLEAKGAGDKDFANGRSNLRVTKVDASSLTLTGFDRQSVPYGCSSAVGSEGGQLAIVPNCSYRQQDTKVEVLVGLKDLPPGGVAVGDLVELYATFKQKEAGKKKVTLRLENAYFVEIERADKTVFKR